MEHKGLLMISCLKKQMFTVTFWWEKRVGDIAITDGRSIRTKSIS